MDYFCKVLLNLSQHIEPCAPLKSSINSVVLLNRKQSGDHQHVVRRIPAFDMVMDTEFGVFIEFAHVRPRTGRIQLSQKYKYL